jgi:hypothetical protein
LLDVKGVFIAILICKEVNLEKLIRKGIIRSIRGKQMEENNINSPVNFPTHQ